MASTNKEEASRVDQEYLELLAKEFSSIPDREVPANGLQNDDDQLTAMKREIS